MKQFRAVSEQPLPSAAIATDSKNVLSDLRSHIDAAQENPSDASSTPPTFVSSLRTMLKEARDAKTAYERANAELQTIISEAQASGTTATLTLREAVQKLKQGEARARASLIVATVDDAQKKIDLAIAEERANQEATEKGMELKRIQAVGHQAASRPGPDCRRKPSGGTRQTGPPISAPPRGGKWSRPTSSPSQAPGSGNRTGLPSATCPTKQSHEKVPSRSHDSARSGP